MRGANLSGIATAHMIEQMIDGYEGAFVEESGKAESPPETIDLIVKTATRRTWKGLAKERIENTKPSIPLGGSFWPLLEAERARQFDRERVRPRYSNFNPYSPGRCGSHGGRCRVLEKGVQLAWFRYGDRSRPSVLRQMPKPFSAGEPAPSPAPLDRGRKRHFDS
jgi:hypothetical protein